MQNLTFRGGEKVSLNCCDCYHNFLSCLYHLLLIYVVPYSNLNAYKAVELPLHIGVILFVLLSGYFTIKPSSKGLIRLLFVFFVYSLPELYFNLEGAQDIKQIIGSVLLLSHTHFWFIRTYLCLYLLSPILNVYIDKTTIKQRIYILVALFFICIYIGTSHGDPTLSQGKNVVNFMFLYILGNSIRFFKCHLEKINLFVIIALWCLLNVILISSYVFCDETIFGTIIWHLSFPYCSPLLLINSMLFFIVFCKFTFRSNVVNWLAKSSLAIYLIHANRPLFIMNVRKFPINRFYV